MNKLHTVCRLTELIPAELLVVYVILWRFSTTIIGAVIGGFVLLKELGTDEIQAPATTTLPE